MSPRVVVLTRSAPLETGLDTGERPAPSDVVLDLERLIPALSPVPRHQGGDADTASGEVAAHLRHVALGAFSSALDRASHLRENVTVWVLHPYPSAAQVASYRERGFEVRGS